MLTRGADANHLYLQVVGDGDPHDITRPDNVRPPTATDILESILARDDGPVSATTTAREHASPTLRLGAATARYLDALHVAAEHHLGATAVAAVEAGADRIVPGIGDDPAWPTLRAHLVLLAATGAEPLAALEIAASSRELDSADDRAAVLDWRLDDHLTAGNGPLPWLPGIPSQLRDDPHWSAYLTARSELVTDLATDVRHQVTSTANTPPWWPPSRSVPGPDLLGDLAVWRAATNVPDSDQRPTGPAQPAKVPALWQRDLQARLGSSNAATVADWTSLIHELVPAARRDDFAPRLAENLADLAGQRHRREHRAAHRRRRAPTRRPRRLRPLVAHPTPPARPQRPRRARSARVAQRGRTTAVRDRDAGPRRATPQRPQRTSPGPVPHDQPAGRG